MKPRCSRRDILVGSALFISGFGAITYLMVKATIKTIDSIVNPQVMCLKKKAQYIYIDRLKLAEDPNYPLEPDDFVKMRNWSGEPIIPLIKEWVKKKKVLIEKRLIEMAQEADTLEDRVKPLNELLTRYMSEDCDYRQIAQICNAKIAVTFARMKGVDSRLFLKPPTSINNSGNLESVKERLQKLLKALWKDSGHDCVEVYLNKAFPNDKEDFWNPSYFSSIYMRRIASVMMVTDEHVVPKAVEMLLHHCLTFKAAKDVADCGGIPLLYDIYKLFKDNTDVTIALAQILVEISRHQEYLNNLFYYGWIGLLAEWSNSEDQRLSSPAASALANLESDSEAGCGFDNSTCLLYPAHRTSNKTVIDVVLIHGLMGGPHSTWRKGPCNKAMDPWLILPSFMQQQYSHSVGTIFNLESKHPHSYQGCKSPAKKFENNDFEFSLTDIPLYISEPTDDEFTVPGNDRRTVYANEPNDSQCWPKDWFPQDIPGLRTIGVSYFTSITDWVAWCPFRPQGIQAKARCLMRSLIDCGVGERPIIWISHSMGGIIVKDMLVEASKIKGDPRYENFCKNTKAIYFFSTPHFGSSLVSKPTEIYRYFLMPSKDVEDLKFNCPVLLNIHNEFIKMVKKYSFEVVSFLETKATRVAIWDMEIKCLPEMTSDPGTGVIYELPLGHVDICKPTTRLSFIYQKILRTIRAIVEHNN